MKLETKNSISLSGYFVNDIYFGTIFKNLFASK